MIRYVLDVRTVTPHFPGIGRYVRNIARRLPPLLDDDEKLILLAHPAGEYPEKEEIRQRENATAVSAKAVSAKATPFSLVQQWEIPRLLRKQDTPHSRNMLYHSPYYVMPYYVPCPALLTFYDTISLTHPDTVSVRARSLFRLSTALALRACDCVITISDATRRDLLSHFDVRPEKVTTVYLGVDEAFSPRAEDEQEAVRTSLGLPQDFLLYFGSNKPHKNLARLVDAYALVSAGWSSDRGRLPPLVIAGSWDNQYPEAKQRAAHHGIEASVHFLGAVQDAVLPALYSAATAFVFPSLYEGFGLPVLEAMACGTPVACSAASSLPEVAGDAAFYFDPYDCHAIAQAMRALAGDATLRTNLSQRGRSRASAFTWETTARKTLDLYRRTLR